MRRILLTAASLLFTLSLHAQAAAEETTVEKRSSATIVRNVSAARQRVLRAKWYQENGRKRTVMNARKAVVLNTQTARSIRRRVEEITERTKKIPDEVPLPLPEPPPELEIEKKKPAPLPKREPPPDTASSHVRSLREALLRIVNDARADEGLSPLTLNPYLNYSAQLYAENMEQHDFFSHKDQNGNYSVDRIRAAGYLDSPCKCKWHYWTGENLALNQDTVEEVMEAWMNSSGHRKNILKPEYAEMGIGWSNGYWVQHFGRIQVK